MNNPFEIIDKRLINIECLLIDIKYPEKQKNKHNPHPVAVGDDTTKMEAISPGRSFAQSEVTTSKEVSNV